MQKARQTPTQVVKPHNISEIFQISIHEYDGNQIFFNAFIIPCNTSYNVAVDNQQILAVLHKKKTLDVMNEFVNSRNPTI